MIWKLIAFIVSRQFIADYLIGRATRTPYFNLPNYMDRWWLFNAYDSDPNKSPEERQASKRYQHLPSVRVHHILREDRADHPHDHPWNARTILLRGWYIEQRLCERDHEMLEAVGGWTPVGESITRKRGDTAQLLFGEYHHIQEVSPGGVWTLFITWDFAGKWGFLVDGVKMPWKDYVKQYPERVA